MSTERLWLRDARTGQVFCIEPAVVCTCVPCTSPGYGVPGHDHCAACCYGTLIEAYDYDCPIEAHREMAVRQFGERN